jgi:hypothetical protein
MSLNRRLMNISELKVRTSRLRTSSGKNRDQILKILENKNSGSEQSWKPNSERNKLLLDSSRNNSVRFMTRGRSNDT